MLASASSFCCLFCSLLFLIYLFILWLKSANSFLSVLFCPPNLINDPDGLIWIRSHLKWRLHFTTVALCVIWWALFMHTSLLYSFPWVLLDLMLGDINLTDFLLFFAACLLHNKRNRSTWRTNLGELIWQCSIIMVHFEKCHGYRAAIPPFLFNKMTLFILHCHL